MCDVADDDAGHLRLLFVDGEAVRDDGEESVQEAEGLETVESDFL